MQITRYVIAPTSRHYRAYVQQCREEADLSFVWVADPLQLVGLTPTEMVEIVFIRSRSLSAVYDTILSVWQSNGGRVTYA